MFERGSVFGRVSGQIHRCVMLLGVFPSSPWSPCDTNCSSSLLSHTCEILSPNPQPSGTQVHGSQSSPNSCTTPGLRGSVRTPVRGPRAHLPRSSMRTQGIFALLQYRLQSRGADRPRSGTRGTGEGSRSGPWALVMRGELLSSSVRGPKKGKEMEKRA